MSGHQRRQRPVTFITRKTAQKFFGLGHLGEFLDLDPTGLEQCLPGPVAGLCPNDRKRPAVESDTTQPDVRIVSSVIHTIKTGRPGILAKRFQRTTFFPAITQLNLKPALDIDIGNVALRYSQIIRQPVHTLFGKSLGTK